MNMPMFDADAIREVLSGGGNYVDKYFESIIKDDDQQMRSSSERFEVLEYWGCIDADILDRIGINSPDADPLGQVQANIWVCGGQVLRAVINPFIPMRIPYQIFPYEISPYQIWGIGIPENMEDAQMLMNGHVRMAIDNLSLAGNMVFDIDETSLVPGQNYEIFPGKVFRRQSGVTGTAINGIKFPNTAGENIQMYDKARQLADEETGIPSIMHGQTGVTGTGRTAAGLSMLLGSAGLSIKTVIKNIDDHLLKPMGEAFFQWNMQFNEDAPEIKGDLHVKARGTSSLMQKEVRSQRLMTFLQVASNQNLAPFVRWHTILSEIAKSLDIEPEKLINDPEKAAIFAKIMGMANGNQQTQGNNQQPSMASDGGTPAGANPNDPTGSGGGNIGTGSVPQAGESGFSSNATQTEGTT